jgi:hypothetical protein
MAWLERKLPSGAADVSAPPCKEVPSSANAARIIELLQKHSPGSTSSRFSRAKRDWTGRSAASQSGADCSATSEAGATEEDESDVRGGLITLYRQAKWPVGYAYAYATILKECARADGRLRAEAMWQLAKEKGAVGKHHAREFAEALKQETMPQEVAAMLARMARAIKAFNRSNQEEDGDGPEDREESEDDENEGAGKGEEEEEVRL